MIAVHVCEVSGATKLNYSRAGGLALHWTFTLASPFVFFFRRGFRLGERDEEPQDREKVGPVNERKARLASQVSRRCQDSSAQNGQKWNAQQKGERHQWRRQAGESDGRPLRHE